MSTVRQIPPLPHFAEGSLPPAGSVARGLIEHIDQGVYDLFTDASARWRKEADHKWMDNVQEREAKLDDSRIAATWRPGRTANLQVPYSNICTALRRSLATTFAGQLNQDHSSFVFTSGAKFGATSDSITFSMKPSCSYVTHEDPKFKGDLGVARAHRHSAAPVSIMGTWVDYESATLKGPLDKDSGFWQWEWLVEEGEPVPSALPGSVQSGR